REVAILVPTILQAVVSLAHQAVEVHRARLDVVDVDVGDTRVIGPVANLQTDVLAVGFFIGVVRVAIFVNHPLLAVVLTNQASSRALRVNQTGLIVTPSYEPDGRVGVVSATGVDNLTAVWGGLVRESRRQTHGMVWRCDVVAVENLAAEFSDHGFQES